MSVSRLVQSIETHWEDVAHGAIRRIRNDEDVPKMRSLTDLDLLRWTRQILEALKTWAPNHEDRAVSSEYQALGRLRFRKSIPLYEVVRCLHILKLSIVDFIRDHAYAQNTLELYAQEEFEHQITLFFDWLLYNVAVGYEEARRSDMLLKS
jgi:hypothetical protein